MYYYSSFSFLQINSYQQIDYDMYMYIYNNDNCNKFRDVWKIV